MKNFSLENKLILITGVSSGIGRASAVEFSKHNMKLALVARSSQQLKNLKRIESNKKIYKVLSEEMKEYIHSLQILIY